ncbi:MAG: SGNH/GDSL hydrolase family protein [Bryobacteraceae bacterium]
MTRTGVMILAGALLAAQVHAQLADEFNVPAANCCLWNAARSLADQLQDWNQLGRYHAANEALKKQPAQPGRVVFMGDSITDFWRLDEYFPGQPYVNRGIGGQTTPQMLVRMYPDVIELKPAAMVLLAGTNDIARNTGPSTAEMVQHNIMAMSDLARQNGIKVVLCSILPVSDYAFLAQERAGGPPAAARGGGPGRGPMPRMRMTTNHPAEDILKLNAWMQQYAQRVNAIYVDYFSAMVDEKGWLKESLANDGLHPNAEGYKIMAPLVSAAIQKALR